MYAVGLQLFQNFLKSEYSEENLTFWKACQTFKSQRLTPDAALQTRAVEIFAEYISISPSAPNSVSSMCVIRKVDIYKGEGEIKTWGGMVLGMAFP